MSGLIRTTASGCGVGVTFETQVSLYDRVFGGLIALLVLGLLMFVTLLSVWWSYTPAVGARRTVGPPPYPDRLVPVNEKEERLSIAEFDVSESHAFTQVIEMTGASIAELSQSKLPSLVGTGDRISGDDTGLRIRKRQSISAVTVATPQWSVIQEAGNLEDYQSKLDFFGIQIGAVHKSNDKIWRIAELATEKIVTESSRSAESKNRYFVNQQTRLLHWDRQTIAQAGMNLQNVIAVHFYPKELIVKMQQLIDVRYKDRADDLAKVTFRIFGTPGNYQFKIESAQFND